VLLADWLSTLWPRWLLLLGLLLIGVSIGMQRGLWGLGEGAWRRIFRKTSPGAKVPAALGEKA
jgi:branched-chain amino acid transport system permease protein